MYLFIIILLHIKKQRNINIFFVRFILYKIAANSNKQQGIAVLHNKYISSGVVKI